MLASVRTAVAVLVTALGLFGVPAAHAQQLSSNSDTPAVFFNDSTSDPAGGGWSLGVHFEPSTTFEFCDRYDTAGGCRRVIALESSPNNTDSLYLTGLGNVYLANYKFYFDRTSGRMGIGTNDPQGNLHIAGAAGQDLFSGIGPDLVNGPALNFGYAGFSFGRGAGFFNARPDAAAFAPNPSLRFATNNLQRMIITNTGNVGIGTTSPTNPLQMASGARVTAGGVWTDASSREYKQDVQPLTPDEARVALAGLDPVKFAYKADPAEYHVGFVAEDVPALVATADRKGLSPMDIVAVLTRVVQEQQRKLEEQQRKLEAQEAAQGAALAGLAAELAALRRAAGGAALSPQP
jgi:hypothetical protein